VQLYLNPQAEHLLDWFHLTMRLTVLNQTAKGLPESVLGAQPYLDWLLVSTGDYQKSS
jgi:hypothetical protein